MARRKLLENEKKRKIGIAIDIKLDELLNEHLTDIKVNRSKYIENLIKEDMIKRGKDIKSDFEK